MNPHNDSAPGAAELSDEHLEQVAGGLRVGRFDVAERAEPEFGPTCELPGIPSGTPIKRPIGLSS